MALARAWKQMSWFYYQYLLVTALYMLEPWERTVFRVGFTPSTEPNLELELKKDPEIKT
ncbi:serine palmitoyltransferase small subunit A [Prionailurus iriomotensis]